MECLSKVLEKTSFECLETLDKYPLGQRLLKLGIKPVTDSDLRKHFCCDQIAEKANRKLAEKAKKSWKDYKKEHEPLPSNVFTMMWRSFPVPDSQPTWYTCSVKTKPLDEYMEQEIPDYCIDQIEEARGFGFKDFEVAYPVLEEAPQLDPVILAKFGEFKVWITFFE